MGNIADSFGFGAESTEADVKDFESTVTGDAKRGAEADEGHSKDDGSDNAGWDADTDVKDLAGAGKEPKDDDTGAGDDDGEQTDEEKAAAKAAAEAKAKGKDGDEEEDEAGDLPEGVKKRVARANRARDREKERADTAEREAETLRKQLAERDKPADAATTAPKAEDFDDYEDYLQAKKDFEAKPAPKAEDKKPADDTTTQKPDREVVDAVAEVKAILTEAGHEAIFKAVVEAGEKVPVPRDVVLALADPDAFDHPESVLQALLDDPARAVDLAKMKPAARMKHLMTFDKPYKAPAKGEERKPAPKLSEAPPPFDQTNGNAKGAVDLDALPFSEFEKVRNEQESKTKDFW